MTIDATYPLAAREAGFAVVPPHEDGTKRPAGTWKAYQSAPPDAEQVHAWYDRGRSGFGVLCGEASGHLEMLELEGRAAHLWPALRRAMEEAGHLDLLERVADGYAERTPSGGIHLLYRCPEGVEGNLKLARDEAGEVLIETRGEGGYTILAPSCGPVHPSGKAWRIERGSLATVAVLTADERAILLDAARSFDQYATAEPLPIPPAEHVPAPSGEGWFDEVVDAYNRAKAWDDVLEGWARGHTDPKGITYWTRPGKDSRHGYSATTNALGTDRLIVFSSSVPGFDVYDGVGRATSYDRFGAHAVLTGRDRVTCARALRAEGYGPPAMSDADILRGMIAEAERVDPQGEPHTEASEAAEAIDDGLAPEWLPLDLADIAAGSAGAPVPTLLCPAGGLPLVYPGRVNGLFGESGAGKTWVVLAAIAQVLEDGGAAVLIDLEDSPYGIVARLLAMGVPPSALGPDRFSYISPSIPWGVPAGRAVSHTIARTAASLVVIDSTGEALAMGGVKGNDDDDVARWFRQFPRAIASMGPAVLLVDHVPKDPNAPQGYAIGSQRKRAAIDGASYRVDAIKSPAKGREGLLKLVVAKDRHGTRSNGQAAAMVTMTPGADGAVRVDVSAPDEQVGQNGRVMPTTVMERVSLTLEDVAGGLSGNALEMAVAGKAATVRTALRELVEAGHVARLQGPRNGFIYESRTPYRDTREAVDNLVSAAPRPTSSPPRPTSSRDEVKRDITPPRPLVPRVYRAGTRDEVEVGAETTPPRPRPDKPSPPAPLIDAETLTGGPFPDPDQEHA